MTAERQSVHPGHRHAPRIAWGALRATGAARAALRSRAPGRGGPCSAGFPFLQEKGTSHVSDRH